MNRAEHLQWCKDRAIEYARRGDIQGAYASFCSDMRKHEETESHIALDMGMMLMITGGLSTAQKMIDYINGFN